MIYGTESKSAAHAYSTSISPHRHPCTIITKQFIFLFHWEADTSNTQQKPDSGYLLQETLTIWFNDVTLKGVGGENQIT